MGRGVRSSWWLIAAALSCLVPVAFAGTASLQINNPPSSNVLDGIYVGPYGATNTQTGAAVQIICDDFKDKSNYNPSDYTINTFSSLGSTLWGAYLQSQGRGSQITTLYSEAGWLALAMLNFTGTQQGYYSYALWAVFDPTDVFNWLKSSNDTAACKAVFGNNCTSTSVSAGSLLYNAQQNYGNKNYSNLLIYTPKGCGVVGSCLEQEFFQRVPVPEGGSALLYFVLAGVSCFGAMFFSRRQIGRGGLA